MTEIPNYQAGLGMIQQVFSKSASIKSNKKNIITILKSIQSTKQVYDKTYLKNCQDSMARLVIKKRNRPCVALWNVGNECYTFINSNISALASLKEIANTIDGTKPITYSVFTVPKLTLKREKSFDLFDIISINEYYGWYYGKMPQAIDYYKEIAEKYNKPIIITETGSDSNIDNQGIDLESRNANSQEYQEKMILSHLNIKNEVKTFSGVCVWQLKDSFCEEYGEGDLVPSFNAKGLLSSDYHEKSAYYGVQNWNKKN